MRTTAFVVMALVLTLLLAPETSATPAATPPTEVIFVNVGHGDGVVLRISGKIIVSDAGESFAAPRMAEALTSLGAKQIDVAILSHPHDDHVGGFVDLFREFPPRLVLASTNRHWSSTSSNRLLLNEISRSGAPIRWVQAGDRFAFGGASWQILNPPAGEFTAPADAGNSSVVYLLTVHNRRLLFAGDIEDSVANRLASSWLHGRVDVFLVPNQGSKHGATAELLEAIHPRFAVLSVGPNPFGHPAAETLYRLRAALRRWDRSPWAAAGASGVADDGAILVREDPGDTIWLGLERGIEVQFKPPAEGDGVYRSGDFWLIPARVETGDVRWPRTEQDEPLAVPPQGVVHHYAPLAVIFDSTDGASGADCRCRFRTDCEVQKQNA